MKTKLFFATLALTAISVTGFAQEKYVPFIEQGKIWRYSAQFREGNMAENTNWFEDYYSILDGEEVIDGTTYAKGWFYKAGSESPIMGVPAYYVAEDVEAQQVAVLYNYDFTFGHKGASSLDFIGYFGDKSKHIIAYDFLTPENSDIFKEFEDLLFGPHECVLIEGVGYVSESEETYGYGCMAIPYPPIDFISGYQNYGGLLFPYAVESPSRGRIYYKPSYDFAYLSGVEAVTSTDNDAPVEYFNLQGVRVDNPAEGQLLIRRQGNKVDKIIL